MTSASGLETTVAKWLRKKLVQPGGFFGGEIDYRNGPCFNGICSERVRTVENYICDHFKSVEQALNLIILKCAGASAWTKFQSCIPVCISRGNEFTNETVLHVDLGTGAHGEVPSEYKTRWSLAPKTSTRPERTEPLVALDFREGGGKVSGRSKVASKPTSCLYTWQRCPIRESMASQLSSANAAAGSLSIQGCQVPKATHRVRT